MEEEVDLSYSQDTGPWPLQARRGELGLRFSGDFNHARILQEKAVEASAKMFDMIAVGIVVLGLLGFLYGAYSIGLSDFDLVFFFRPAWENLLLWVGVLSALYLWSRRIQEASEYEVTRILSASNLKQWEGTGQGLDVYSLFTRGSRQVWNGVVEILSTNKASDPTSIELLLSLLGHKSIQMVFYRFGVSPENAKQLFSAIPRESLNAELESEYVSKLPFVAFDEALRLRNRSVDPLMLFCGLVKMLPDDHPVQKYFFDLDLSYDKLEVIASWVFNLDLMIEEDKLFRKLASHKSDRGINKGLTSVPTPYLDQFSVDLTIQAKYHKLPMTLGREEDTDKVLELLSSSGKSVLVMGSVGTGRSTVLAEMAYRMASEQVPAVVQDKRLIRLELAGILGSKASPEQALVNIFNEAGHSGNIIFAVEDVQQLNKAVGGEGLSVLELLLNLMENSRIPLVATTTPESYQTQLRTTATFDERFVTYELQDLDERKIMLASSIQASMLEVQTGAFFQYQAVKEAVRLSEDFFHDVGQPQKTIMLLKEAAQKVKSLPSGPQKLISPEDIQKIVAEKTHVPTSTFTQEEAQKLLNLEEEIGKRVIGQHEAVKAVAEGMRRARSGLSSGQRPLASFLFVGPTGVGKTELAKTLAGVYFGDERYLLRLDMSEYRGDDGMRKLVGIPGQTSATPFVTHLKTYPFSLFLLDELEKASPDILNLFLAVLEDGRITTATGQTLDLTHTIIISTSNAGTPEIQAGITEGRSLDSIRAELMEKILINYYRPEFLNRFDGVILFEPLKPEEIEKITALQLQGVARKLEDKKIKIIFTEATIKKVAHDAFDPLLGGRPIRRYIQDHVESVIAKLLLSKSLDRGGQVTIDVGESGEFISK